MLVVAPAKFCIELLSYPDIARDLLRCRSPTVVIGYLMKLRGWRLAESYKWVKDKRPQIHISEGEYQLLH